MYHDSAKFHSNQTWSEGQIDYLVKIHDKKIATERNKSIQGVFQKHEVGISRSKQRANRLTTPINVRIKPSFHPTCKTQHWVKEDFHREVEQRYVLWLK